MSAAKRPVASLDRRERQINKPPLLNGESILAEAQSVLKFNNMSKRGSGVMGSLYITNFKLAFMVTKVESNASISQRMLQLSCRTLDDLLVDDESGSDCEYIPLTGINYLTAISTLKQVSKKLRAGKVPSKKYDIIELSCRDLRVIQFDFSLCREKEKAAVINTIHVYSSPTNVQKLFAFDYAIGSDNSAKASSRGRAFHTFRHEKDLELELARLRAQQHWRISKVNQDFSVCKTLPEINLVPAALDDRALQSIAGLYVDGRFPSLVWHSRESGAALLSSSAPSDQEDVGSGHSQKVMQAVREAFFTPSASDPIIIDASLLFPSLKELQASYCQLFDTCLCHSSKEFWATDSTWLGKLDNSRWLQNVQTALTTASEIANSLLIKQTSVIIHGLSGRDYTPLVVSLVQLLVDPYYRTVIGLESLIQKEWVVKGHPFCQRLGLIKESTKTPKNWVFYKDDYVIDTDESPIFILFLDCVHQLLTQFPSRFGFTEQFLLLLIDSVYMCLFETFLFDTDYDRKRFNNKALESLWDFVATKVAPIKFQTLFLNKLYNIDKSLNDEFQHSVSSLENYYLFPDTLSVSSNELVTTLSLNSISKSPKKSRKTKKGKQVQLSFNTQYQSAKDPNVFVINPDASSVHVQLWHEYFLRWTPTVDLSKGSSSGFSQYLQQVELLEELKYLEDRLEHLRSKCDELDSPTENVSPGHKPLTLKRSGKGLNVFNEENYNELLSHFTFCKLIHPSSDTTLL